MEVDTLPLGSSYTEDDEGNLKILLKTFGSVVSLKDIASAYCESGRNLVSTVEMLSNVEGSTAISSSYTQEDVTVASSSGSFHNEHGNAHIAKSKAKICPATMGAISDVIGKDYISCKSHSNGSKEKEKPVKLHSDDFPASEIWDEKKRLASTSSGESMDDDIQEFLLKMLGCGFQLDVNVIQEVISQCGYDIPMSIDKLLNMSATTLEKSDDVIGTTAGHEEPATGRLKANINAGDELKVPQTETSKKDIQREVLNSLFRGPDRFEEKRKSTVPIRPARRSPYGEVVTKPLEHSPMEDFTFMTRQPADRTDESNESSYEELRKAVREYWDIVREYYKASTMALMQKDNEKAKYLMEQGNFYMSKAREADKNSAKKLIENSNAEDLSLSMHNHEPREALKLLKFHLKLYSGLPTIKHLKIVVGTEDGDKKLMRRKRRITELLEQEGIPWTEEGNNGWTISIRVCEVDPRKLSFANK